MRQDDEDEDTPLDPTLERVQARLRRLILISGATLGVGFIAVILAVIFRVSNLDRASGGAPFHSTLEIPAGATVITTDLDAGRIAVTIEEAGSRKVLVFDLASGRRLGEAVILAR